MKVLATGVTGKVGGHFLKGFLADPRFRDAEIVALCNNRTIPESDRVSVIRGSIADPQTIETAMQGVTHVVHMAAVKESPDLAIDVCIKGMFLMLEAHRASPTARQFMLIGGDCSVGHMFHKYPAPVTETSAKMAYPGCYALTKVLEEVMLEQYQFQYGLNGCILRAPWIMEKDDFRFAISFGPDQFGGPAWSDILPEDEISTYAAGNFAPLLKDSTGAPLRRNFVHVDDLVAAMLAAFDNPVARGELFNIAMTDALNYADAAQYLAQSRGFEIAEIDTPYHSNLLDNAKARQTLGWRPQVDLRTLIDRAFDYERAPDDQRKIWYPG